MKKLLLALALIAGISGPLQAQNYIGPSMGIRSVDATLSPGQILFGGTVGIGDVATVHIAIGGTTYDFPQTGIAGDTPTSLMMRYIAPINAALGSGGIAASQANPALAMLAISPQRNGSALPVISATFSAGAAVTASIVSQADNHLDASPGAYCSHTPPSTSAPVSGDSVCLSQEGGPDTSHPGQTTIAYGWHLTRIVDPAIATLQGATDWGGACNVAANGYVCPTHTWQRGVQLEDAAGAFPVGGDMGYGTVNYPTTGGLYRDGVKAAARVTIGGNSVALLASNATNWVGSAGSSSADIFGALMPVAVPGTLKTLSVSANSAPGAGQSYTASVLINGSASGLTCTIADSASFCSDAIHQPNLTAPASLTLQVVLSPGAMPAKILWEMELDSPF